MDTRPLRHRVERTTNKHSRAICKDDTIVIRLAKNLSKTEEQEHIQSLLRRMTHLVLQEREKTMIDPFRSILNGNHTQSVRTAHGKSYQFTLNPATKTKVRKTSRGLVVDISPHIRRNTLHRLLWNTLAQEELDRVTKLVHTINKETYRVKISKVRLSFATTQWGSCSPSGVIMLNAALLFLPPSILRYVIVHELAHRIHANHSAAYWNTVKRAMPSYKKPYEALQKHRLPQL